MFEKIVIEKIIWNRCNLGHIKKHGITQNEIKEESGYFLSYNSTLF